MANDGRKQTEAMDGMVTVRRFVGKVGCARRTIESAHSHPFSNARIIAFTFGQTTARQALTYSSASMMLLP